MEAGHGRAGLASMIGRQRQRGADMAPDVGNSELRAHISNSKQEAERADSNRASLKALKTQALGWRDDGSAVQSKYYSCKVQFPAHTSGSSQLPVTLAPENPTSFSGFIIQLQSWKSEFKNIVSDILPSTKPHPLPPLTEPATGMKPSNARDHGDTSHSSHHTQ